MIAKKVVHYPDSDGLPIADNTLQFDWIALVKWNAEAYYRDDGNVFVAGDHLIYAAEGDPKVRCAPDIYVAYGRPKGYRGSYRVWDEAGVFPQVVFEVWSPFNRLQPMEDKRVFYERYGAEEYYVLYPDFPAYAEGWRRGPAGQFERVPDMNQFVSPRLGFRFTVVAGEMTLHGPDGRELVTPDQIARQRDAAEQQRDAAEQQRDAVAARAARLAERLRELGIDPDAAG